MKKIPMNVTNRLEIESIQGFFAKTVTRFGTSAKVDCPTFRKKENYAFWRL